MITLYGFGPGFGLPERSPFVTKTEVQLKLAALPYAKRLARPDDSPKGQLPFIADEGALIADSTFIRAHLERTYRVDLDEGLSPAERAAAWAIERMIENHLGPTLAYQRWLIPANFKRGPSHFADPAPAPARPALRARMLAHAAEGLRSQGVARHAPEEVVQLGVKSLAALCLFLGDKPCLMGAKPTGVDAVAFAMLAGVLTPFFDGDLRRRAEDFDNLVVYVERMMARFFPDHRWARPIDLTAEPMVA
jgi:glutathione S-transferase